MFKKNYLFFLPVLIWILSLPAFLQSSGFAGEEATQTKETSGTVKSSTDQSFERYEQVRDQAVLKALKWIDSYLDREAYFKAMPYETYQVFHEFALTSANPEIKAYAEKAREKYAKRLLQHYLDFGALNTGDFFNALDFYADRQYLGELELDPLLEKAKESWKGWAERKDSLGFDIDGLSWSANELYDLVHNSYIILKVNASISEEYDTFTVYYPLEHAFEDLKKERLAGFKDDDTEEKDLAKTHMKRVFQYLYTISGFSRNKVNYKDALWFYKYLHENFNALMEDGDIALIGEYVDAIRTIGYDEKTDKFVLKGSEFLLKSQKPDGSWGDFDEYAPPQQRVFTTWCAASGLKSRIFLPDTKLQDEVKQILKKFEYDKPYDEFDYLYSSGEITETTAPPDVESSAPPSR
ncbi:hypothetical protein JXA32_01065 [Candidatus Sumerlaeota bacterium]|nr:hypothetical protein [Candidatus Sumerlaeota bacterium]